MDSEAVKPALVDAGAAVSVSSPARSIEQLLQRDIDRMKVDVAKLCCSRAGRERVYRVLCQVHRWGLLRDIAPYVRVEKGAAARGPIGSARGVADRCHAAIHTGFNVFDELSQLMECVVGAWPQFAKVAREPTAYEGIVQFHLQRWLDALAESLRHVNGFVLETIAGFGGCGVEGLRRFGASTGVEAAWRVSWSIRHAIADEQPHPFLWLGLVAGEEPKSQPATGRDRPALPDETAEDDRALLLAVASGATTPKRILAELQRIGATVRYQLVRQRKKDLVAWGLLAKKRGWELTELGQAWVCHLREPRATPSASPGPRGARATT